MKRIKGKALKPNDIAELEIDIQEPAGELPAFTLDDTDINTAIADALDDIEKAFSDIGELPAFEPSEIEPIELIVDDD